MLDLREYSTEQLFHNEFSNLGVISQPEANLGITRAENEREFGALVDEITVLKGLIEHQLASEADLKSADL